MSRHYTYTVSVKKQPGGYLAEVPALPGCFTWGKTYEDTVNHVREAIEGYLEAMTKLGRPIPVETMPRKLHLNVSFPVMA